jgi:hypothetical protein
MAFDLRENPRLGTGVWDKQIAVLDSASETMVVSHLLPNLLERVFLNNPRKKVCT